MLSHGLRLPQDRRPGSNVMRYYAGLDVSMAETSICIVDEDGKIIREAKVASEPEPLATWLGDLGLPISRVAWRPARSPDG